MTKLTRPLILSAIIVLILGSCSFPGTTKPKTKNPLLPDLPVLTLTTTANPTTYDQAGQVITLTYVIKNTGTSDLSPAQFTVSDSFIGTAPFNCGAANVSLIPNATVTCTATYTITAADLTAVSVKNTATASGAGQGPSPSVSVTINKTIKALTLTTSANPVTYNQAGQVITFTYIILNSGNVTLGPSQFTVSDSRISAAPFNCGDANTSLAPNATVSCTATYTVTQADMSAASVSTSATASTASVAPSQPASAAITKSTVAQTNPNLAAGSTIRHQVVSGEWLIQIARCYGANYNRVRAANPQLSNPAEISPDTTVSVPNIGSDGKIYGPPCVGTHTVQSGDTWNSIALKYNADPSVLQAVNLNTLTVGKVLKVPLNSAGGSTPATGGNCVDLTRSLKLAGVNANTTHFNLCGTLDSAGNMKINTINIYQRPEDVGLGGLSQNITSVPVETSTALNNANSLIVGDMNYDGNDDFRIVKLLPAGPNIPYLYYLYDPGTRNFIYNKAYENITSPEFPGNSEIRSKWRESAAKSGIDTYTVANNTPKLTRRETWEALNAAQAMHIVTVFNADGTSQVTVNEIVALPIP